MSPPNYVGYDHDPLPPDRFRISFGPPKRSPKRQPEPVPVAPPRPLVAAPRPRVVAPPPPAPPPPRPVAQRVALPPPPPRAPSRPPEPPRPVKVLRPQLEPRNQQVASFPTWKPRPAPVVQLPAQPVARVQEIAHALPLPAVLALRLVAALLLMAPLGWLLGWFGLPATSADFLMTAPGRLAWRAFGGPDAMLFYWVMLFPPSLALSLVPRLAGPLCTLGGFYWTWEGLHRLLGAPGPWVPW